MPLRTLQCHNPGLMALDNPQIASASIGMLLPLIGALAVWPMFAFGKRVVGMRSAAIAAALFPVMPLFAMWPAQWDQVYPLLLFIGLYYAHIYLANEIECTLLLASGAGEAGQKQVEKQRAICPRCSTRCSGSIGNRP